MVIEDNQVYYVFDQLNNVFLINLNPYSCNLTIVDDQVRDANYQLICLNKLPYVEKCVEK